LAAAAETAPDEEDYYLGMNRADEKGEDEDDEFSEGGEFGGTSDAREAD
jgi:hypothetical protein